MGAVSRAEAGRHRPAGRRALAVATLGLALVLAGCGSGSPSASSSSSTSSTSSSAAPSSTTTRPGAARTTLAVFFLRGSYLGVAHRTVPATVAVATAALTALVGGPSVSEAQAGLSSAVPSGTRLLGVHVASGTATVDLDARFATAATPGEELGRVAQVVYTLTQFPTVSRVLFEIAGTTPSTFASGAVSLRHALGRMDVLGAVPAILVETPAVGDSLHGSVRLSGMANVFEAQFHVQLVDGTGKVLVDEPVRASAGTGTWGTFDATFHFDASTTTTGTLRVYDVSQKDGSPIDEVDLHLTTGP